MAEIKSVNELLKMNINIPDYQRPYKWDIQNIEDLFLDITNAISDADRYRTEFKYRIGTIILHQTEDNTYDVVDGQQRIIALVLLKQCSVPFLKRTLRIRSLNTIFTETIRLLKSGFP